jgi:hypothetical protein
VVEVEANLEKLQKELKIGWGASKLDVIIVEEVVV